MKVLLYILTGIFVFIGLQSGAQTVSGKWYGVGNVDVQGSANNYLIEIILEQKGSVVTGEFNYYFKDAYFPNKISGTYDSRSRRLTIKSFPVTYFRSVSAVNGVDCNMTGDFTLLVAKTGSLLKGKFSSSSFYASTCPDIVMSLNFGKDEPYVEVYEEPEAEPELETVKAKDVEVPVTEAVIKEKTIVEKQFEARKKEDAGFLEFDSTNITIQVIDNGEIDKDSVSLFFNNKVLAEKVELTKRGLVYNVSLDTTIINEISMFAENLGLIPPNTAVMIIYDGKKRHEVTLTSTLQTNGTIRIRKKPTVQ